MGDFALDMLQLPGGAKRAHLGFFRERVANDNLPGHRSHLFQKLIGDIFMQIEARSRHTALPRRAEYPSDRGVDRTFNIGVVKNDEG